MCIKLKLLCQWRRHGGGGGGFPGYSPPDIGLAPLKIWSIHRPVTRNQKGLAEGSPHASEQLKNGVVIGLIVNMRSICCIKQRMTLPWVAVNIQIAFEVHVLIR